MRLFAIPIAALLALAAPAWAEIAVQVEPSSATLVAPAGAPASAAITIRNLGSTPARARVRLADLLMATDGSRDLRPAGYTNASLDGVLRFEPTEFRLGAGEARNVRLSAALADGGAATRYGALIVELRAADETGPWPARPVPAGPGATIFVTRASASVAAPEIAGLTVKPEGASGFQVGVRVWNSGERPIQVGGEVTVRDSLGNIRAKGKLSRGVVLPRALRLLTWTSTARVPAGRHQVVATVGAARSETVVPWPLGRAAVLQPAANRER